MTAHHKRPRHDRTVLHEPIPPARRETILRSIEATVRACADPALAEQRRHNLKVLAELRALLGDRP